MADVGNYAGAVLLGTAMSLSAVTIVGRFGLGHSRSVYVIHALLLFLALIGSRLSFRFFDSFAHRLSGVREDNEKTRVLIYGAGRGGKFLVDEMMYNEKYASSGPSASSMTIRSSVARSSVACVYGAWPPGSRATSVSASLRSGSPRARSPMMQRERSWRVSDSTRACGACTSP